MKVGLDVKERLKIMDILPPEGNIAQLRMIRTLVQRVGISAKESKEFQIMCPEQGIFQWNAKGNKPVMIVLEDAEVEIIKNNLKLLNEKGKLNRDMISLYEKFFPE